jgi:uncharacterized membrane protein
VRISWRTEWLHWLLIGGMFGLTAASWAGAPDRIPVHWNLAGQVDRWGGRFEGLLAIPLLALGIYALFLLLPRLDPGRANYPAFAGAYGTLRIAVLALMAALHGVVILATRGVPVRVETVVPLGVGALFVVVGNVMGKVRPNWFVGIRNPWTLSSKEAWSRTHRLGGWAFIVCGLLFMGTAAIREPWAAYVTFGFLGVMVIGLNVYAWMIWRRDPERTPPAGTSPAEDR